MMGFTANMVQTFKNPHVCSRKLFEALKFYRDQFTNVHGLFYFFRKFVFLDKMKSFHSRVYIRI